jgi:conjugal transfer/type IV secretion protein DotA/TraY
MEAMIQDMDSAASEFVTGFMNKRTTGNGTLPDIETRIQRAASNYEQTVQRALPAQSEQNGIQDAVRNYLDTYGWAALGAWYQTFATANQRLTEVASRAPATSGMSSLGEIGSGDLFQCGNERIQNSIAELSYSPALGTTISNDEQTAVDGNDPNSYFMKTVGGPMQRLTKLLSNFIYGTGL